MESPKIAARLMTPTERVCAGRSRVLSACALGGRMERLPSSLAIAVWTVGASWAVALLIYFFDGPREFIVPLVVLGVLTGIAEWYMRRR
jgi:hypothetical protein